MATENYSALDTFIYITTHNDITFRLEGAADGDFITVDLDNDTVISVEGAQGDVQHSQHKSSLGTVGWVGQWGSTTNKYLNWCFNRQQEGNYLKKLEVKKINQTENVTLHAGDKPMIMKPATNTLGTQAANRNWSFKVENLTYGDELAPV